MKSINGIFMIIDLRKIKQSGKGEEDFYFEYLPDADISTIPSVQIKPPVKVLGKVILTSDKSAVIEAEITFTLSGECTRCLSFTEKTYTIDFEDVFETAATDGAYEIVNDKIDLSKPVNDALILEMPLSFVCKDDCEGIIIK